MLEMLKNWYSRRLSDPHAMGLLAILLFGFIAIYFFSDLIAPLLIAIVLAYLLEMPINFLTKKLKFPRMLATLIIFGGFLTLALLIFFGLVPTLWNQTISLLSDLPAMFNKLHEWLLALPEHYPELIDYTMIDTFFSAARAKILGFGESAVKLSITSLMNLVSLGIYAFLVPLMMFFMLKDKTELLAGVSRFLPKNRLLASKVWNEMQQQIANYIHGWRGDLYYLFKLWFKLSAVTFCCRRSLCLSPLYWCGIGDDSRCFSRHVPVWHFPNVLVFNCGLCGESTSRWKLVGAVFIL